MASRHASDIQTWDNEGGSVPARAPAPPKGGLLPLMRHTRQPQDTAAGCRLRAEADLKQAERMDTARGRERFEHSAACWTARGDLLARLDASRAARQAIERD